MLLKVGGGEQISLVQGSKSGDSKGVHGKEAKTKWGDAIVAVA